MSNLGIKVAKGEHLDIPATMAANLADIKVPSTVTVTVTLWPMTTPARATCYRCGMPLADYGIPGRLSGYGAAIDDPNGPIVADVCETCAYEIGTPRADGSRIVIGDDAEAVRTYVRRRHVQRG